MGSFIKIALLCFTATGLPTIHCRPNSGDGTYLPTHTHPANTGWIKTSGIIVKQDPLKKDAGKKKKSLHTCDSLCKNKKLIDSSMQIEDFYSKSFNIKNNQYTIYKCHSYLAAYANWIILKKLGLPLPPDPLVPQMFTIDQKKLLGSKTKDLTQNGWHPIDSSKELNALFKKFVEQNRLKLCMASALGVGDLGPQNIFYKKNKHGKIEFVIADYDTRSKISMIPHYYANLTINQKKQVIKFVQGNLYKNLLEKVFQIISYPKREKQIFLDSLQSYIKVAKKIENITDKQKLKKTKTNPHLQSQNVLFGNPYFIGSEFGFEPEFATTKSSSVICECN
jgi:hypothetical protein